MAETWSFVKAAETWQRLLIKLVDIKSKQHKLTMTSFLDKSLRVDMTILCEMMQKGERNKLKWISSDKLAVFLTKTGCSSTNLLYIFQNNQL